MAGYTPEPNSGCWLWGGGISNGYGIVRYNGQRLGTHRAMALAQGWDITDRVVRHACDNRCCINPDHLRVGTQADNMADKVARGRSGKGRPKGVRAVPEWSALKMTKHTGRIPAPHTPQLRMAARRIKSIPGMVTRLAKHLRITRAAIYQWDIVPVGRLAAVAKFTDIPREQLRPDLYRAAR